MSSYTALKKKVDAQLKKRGESETDGPAADDASSKAYDLIDVPDEDLNEVSSCHCYLDFPLVVQTLSTLGGSEAQENTKNVEGECRRAD